MKNWPASMFAKTKVDPESGCWLWSTSILPKNGYPIALGPAELTPAGKGRSAGAHRWAYIATHGSIPDGLEIDHLCSVRHCINPDHLEAVTHEENMRRMKERRQGRPRKTKVREFPWAPVNVRAHLAARQIRHGELGKALGLSTGATHYLLAGKGHWTRDNVERAAEFLGLAVADLAAEWPSMSDREQVSA